MSCLRRRMTHSLLMGARASELAVVCWCVVAAVVGPGATARRTRSLARDRRRAACWHWRHSRRRGCLTAGSPVWRATWRRRSSSSGRTGLRAGTSSSRSRTSSSDSCRSITGCSRRCASRRVSRAGSSWALEVLESAYFSVYALLPLGAWAAWCAGRLRERGRLLDGGVPVGGVVLHRAGLAADAPTASARAVGRRRCARDRCSGTPTKLVLTHGSHHMNTIPSGHAAGAVAVALALGSLQAPTAPLFGVARRRHLRRHRGRPLPFPGGHGCGCRRRRSAGGGSYGRCAVAGVALRAARPVSDRAEPACQCAQRCAIVRSS